MQVRFARSCYTAFFLCGHCLTSWKACKQVIPICRFGVDYVALSSVALRGRPPFLPASEAICRRRSAESFWARALPPMRANSVTVSGFFFMPAIYHAAGMQAADIRIAARAFSLIVASLISTEEDGITAGGRSRTAEAENLCPHRRHAAFECVAVSSANSEVSDQGWRPAPPSDLFPTGGQSRAAQKETPRRLDGCCG